MLVGGKDGHKVSLLCDDNRTLFVSVLVRPLHKVIARIGSSLDVNYLILFESTATLCCSHLGILWRDSELILRNICCDVVFHWF